MSKKSANNKIQSIVSNANFDVANRLFFRLYQSSNLMHKTGTKSLTDFNCTTQQWAVLGALSRPSNITKGMTVKNLLEFLMVSRQNITLVLDRLEERGWIERVKDDDDGRNRRIRLTKIGQNSWAQILEAINNYYADALSDFDIEEQILLHKLLNKLKNSLSKL